VDILLRAVLWIYGVGLDALSEKIGFEDCFWCGIHGPRDVAPRVYPSCFVGGLREACDLKSSFNLSNLLGEDQVTEVARRNGTAASVVFTWRRQANREGRAVFRASADRRGGNERGKCEASVR
jgi:hypothetical protein